MPLRNIRENAKRCVTCKHWYNPGDIYLKPTRTKYCWEYDSQVVSKCMLTRSDRKGDNSACSRFESRF